MKSLVGVLLVALLAGQGCTDSEVPPTEEPTQEQESSAAPAPLTIGGQEVLKYTGDLPDIEERRILRILVNYNQTNFFLVGGEPKGFEYELLHEFEKKLNKGISRRDMRMTLVFVPVPRAELFSRLNAGWGDIAAAGLTITEERKGLAAFSTPYLTGVDEVIVTRKGEAAIQSLDELEGRTIHVQRASSFAGTLKRLSEDLVARGKKAIEIVEVAPHLETEDLLELVNGGFIEATVSDDHVAELWQAVLPELQIHTEAPVHSGGEIAWAVRESNPELLKEVDAFLRPNRKGTLLGNILFRRYFRDPAWLRDTLTTDHAEKLDEFRASFEKFGEAYGFDWLLLAAVAFQESKFNAGLRSRRGALGLMQVKPATAGEFGITDLMNPTHNIEAGTRYLDWIRKHFFPDADMDEFTTMNFLLASYNAGPSRIRGLRRKASEQGLDPNVWFRSVDQVALQSIGQETVRYVTNVQKYHFAFGQIARNRAQREAERDKLRTPPK